MALPQIFTGGVQGQNYLLKPEDRTGFVFVQPEEQKRPVVAWTLMGATRQLTASPAGSQCGNPYVLTP